MGKAIREAEEADKSQYMSAQQAASTGMTPAAGQSEGSLHTNNVNGQTYIVINGYYQPVKK